LPLTGMPQSRQADSFASNSRWFGKRVAIRAHDLPGSDGSPEGVATRAEEALQGSAQSRWR
jgi:hypothetical protein